MYSATEQPLLVARAATFPVEAALELYAAPEPFEATRRFFRENAEARLALEVASSSLFRAVEPWIAGGETSEKSKLSALSYALRMTTRCTPFGLFAGVSELTFGESTTAAIDSSLAQSHTRADMSIIATIVQVVESAHRNEVRYVSNECAFSRGDRLHVIDVMLGTGSGAGTIEQRDVSLRNTRAVQLVRAYCAAPQRFADIVAMLSATFDANSEESQKLATRLIEAGVLISELRPSTLGDPIAYVQERLHAIGASEADTLARAESAAAVFDARPHAEAYRRVLAAYAGVAPEHESCVQIDLRAGANGAIASRIAIDVARAADLLMRSGRVFRMTHFRQRFRERFEGNERLVPLLELVDGTVGLGVPEGASLEAPAGDRRAATLMSIFGTALRDGVEEIELTGEMLDAILPAHGDGRALRAFELAFAIDADDAHAVDDGRYRLAVTFATDRPGKSVTRFSRVLGAQFQERLQAVVRAAYDPDEIVAEFTFAPMASRTYNVCVRPLLHRYELRSGIGSPACGETISLADLHVGIDRDESFYLWSASLRRRITVAETHALGTAISAPNLCRFLAQIQLDGVRVAELHLGAAEMLPYLPRLVSGRVVLRPRRWLLPRESCTNADGLALQRARWNLPRYAYLRDGDHRLLLDLDAEIVPRLIAMHVKNAEVHIEEALPAPDRMWLRSPDGSHAAEIVASVCLQERAPRAAVSPALVTERQSFGLASEWIYAKYYAGARMTDELLLRELAPMLRAFEQSGEIDRWFFIRYADPQPHVRLRIHSPSKAEVIRERVAAHAETLIERRFIDRVSFDTYLPEYERYGGEASIERAEQLFHLDSVTCLAWLGEGHTSTNARVEAAAASFDEWLRSSHDASERFIRIAAKTAEGKLLPFDREALQRLRKRAGSFTTSPLDDGFQGDGADARLGAFLHMHCNRFGLDGDSERRVAQLLRALALGRIHMQRGLLTSTGLSARSPRSP